MTQAQIIESNATKSNKMRQLFELGLTRSQVAEILGVGYGFVQNVYAKWAVQQALATTRNIYTLPAFSRRFGVEIEAFGVESQALRRALNAEGLEAWRVTYDGSIQGTSAFELVSPILEGEAGLQQLEKACAVLTRLRAKVNKSCGLHIHIEARSFSLATWKNLFANYANLEPVIDSMMPQSRRAENNRYCRSITAYKAQAERATTVEGLHRALPDRYHKVNTKAYSEHGTVEFRQHSGTVEFAKISNWVSFLHGMISYSEQGYRVSEAATFEAAEAFAARPVTEFYFQRINDLAA